MPPPAAPMPLFFWRFRISREAGAVLRLALLVCRHVAATPLDAPGTREATHLPCARAAQ